LSGDASHVSEAARSSGAVRVEMVAQVIGIALHSSVPDRGVAVHR
jgi:hypothetical protein